MRRSPLAAAAFWAALAAWAQPADLEVIVTASRIEETVGETAASVSVITARELLASGQATLVEALERLAGVGFRSTTGGPAQAEVSMGGFGENSHGRVLVLVDGRRINRPDMAGPNWLAIPVEDVERVEVVRGPAAALYGDHAVAGVVNIVTKKGSDRLGVSISGMGGSYLFNQERLGVSGPVGPLRLALSGERTSSEGYRDRSAWSSVGGTARIDGELGDFEASLHLAYTETACELPGGLTKEQWKADPTQAANPEDEAAERAFAASLALEGAPSDRVQAWLGASYAWRSVATDFVSYASYTDVGIHSLAASPRARLAWELDQAVLAITSGLDLSWDALGFERFADQDRHSKAADADLTKASAGLYAVASLELGERLVFELGGRYELARIAAEAGLGSPLDDSKLHQGWAGSASLLYRVPEQARAWVRFDRLYRYPFLDEQVSYYNFGADEFLSDLDPEWGYGAELGGSVDLAAGLRLAGRGYLLDMADEIAYNGATFRNENLDDTRHLGASLEAGWTAGPFTLAGHYTWQRTTFRSGAEEGNELPLVPNHQAFGELRVRLPFGLEAAANVRYVGECFQGGDNANAQEKIDAYSLLGAELLWRPTLVPGRLEVFVGVENLLDADYAPLVYYSAWSGASSYYPAAGRTWRVGGSYRY